jgi:hypothetical protein
MPDTAEGRMVEAIRRKLIAEQQPTTEIATDWGVVRALKRRGYGGPAARAVEGRLAKAAIRAHPLGYAKGTVKNTLVSTRYNKEQLAFTGWAATQFASSSLNYRGYGWPTRVAKVEQTGLWFLSAGGFLILLLLFVGPARSRIAAASLGSVWLAMMVATAAGYRPVPRYAAEVAPLFWLLEAAAAVLLVTALVEYVRRRDARSAG